MDETELSQILRILKEHGEDLQPHQLEGLKVLWDWHRLDRGGIVADEMGLGKTCMSVVHLWRLLRSGAGPFLVFCPLSVLNHWKYEISRFSCGELYPICFMGLRPERELLLNDIGSKLNHNQVFVMPYHLFTSDHGQLLNLLSDSHFSHVVADEAHILKNCKTQIATLLRDVDSTFLLLTGTPIQNDISELYSLLSFCNPKVFPVEDLKKFVQDHLRDSKMQELKGILKEYSIRRKKEFVCYTLPPMQQVIFYHGLTKKQKELYINILVKNREAISRRADFSLATQLMHLRKAVAHPYLFAGQEPEPFTEGEHIVTSSVKLKVLDCILSYTRRHSHRCLVFSQFTSLLDIVQDYLNVRGWSYERLDGSARADERFTAIKSFQSDNVDVFLLSTKAGGVGLTLTKADTVIFLDSDWNPQNDLQAMARCHRIGQTKPVRVIRLVCRFTVEQVMQSRARCKLRLTDTLTDEEVTKPLAVDLAKMLEHGLARLQEDEEGEQLTKGQLEKIVGRTDKHGNWMELDERGDEEDGNIEDVDEMDEKDVDENDYFLFEGKRYKVDERDRKAMKELIGEKALVSPFKKMTKEERELLDEKRIVAREKRREANERRKQKKWEENGYSSRNLPLERDVETIEIDEERDGDTGEEMHFVTGDITKPRDDKNAVILHVVDDSGNFGSGGVFTALDNVSLSIRDAYDEAGDMEDLTLGDAHLIPIQQPYSVVLLVAQKKTKRDEMRLEALSKAFRRVAQYAKSPGYSVHVARMSHGIKNVSWYAVEKTLKKEFALKGIPVFVYYKPKMDDGRGTEKKRNIVTIDEDNEAQNEPSSSNSLKRRKVFIDSSDSEHDDTLCTNDAPTQDDTLCTNDAPTQETAGVFKGTTIYLSHSTRHLRKKIEAEGGEVVDCPLDLYDVTHAIIERHERDKEKLALQLLPEDTAVRGEQYINQCIRKGTLLP